LSSVGSALACLDETGLMKKKHQKRLHIRWL
jgi:hypothetical protein